MLSLNHPRLLKGACLALLLAAAVAGCGKDPEELTGSAKSRIENGDYKEAVIDLRNALQKDPNLAEARYLLGVALLNTNELPAAEKELRKARELGYPEEKVAPALAMALLRSGQAQAVASEFATVRLTDPVAQSDLRAAVGDALLASGKPKDAADAYGEALAAQPGHPAARVGEARLRLVEKDVAGAEKIVDDVLSSSPARVDALSLKAQLAAAQNRPDEAVSQYRKAVESEPDNIESHLALGLMLLGQGQVEDAKKESDAINKIAPRDTRAFYLRSLIAFKESDYANARDLGLEVLKTTPDHLSTLRVVGASYFFLRSDQQAQQHLDKVLQRTPADLYVRRLLIASCARAGDLRRAKRLLDEGLAIAPKDPGLLVLSGELSLADRDVEDATQAYEQAIAQGITSPALSARLGQLHLAAGDTAEGVELLESASAASEEIQSDVLLVIHYLKQGKVDEALPWIDRIEKKRPEDPTGPALRGAAYLAAKDEAGARASFEKTLKLQPDHRQALVMLAALDIKAKNPDAAERRFQAVLDKEPGNEGVALSYVGFLTAQKASPKRKVEVLTRLIESQPAASRGRVALVGALLEAGEPQNALAAAQQGLATDPENPMLLRALGVAQRAAGDHNQAVNTFAKLATLQPHSPTPLLLLAQANAAAGQQQQALEALERALKVQPDFLPAQIAAAQMHFNAKRTDKALGIARDIQQQRPAAPTGYLLEARILHSAKRMADADQALVAGLKQVPDNTTLALTRYGWLLDAGQTQQAREFAGEWVSKHPKDAKFLTYMGDRAMAAKDLAEASKRYRAALDLAPNNVVLLNNLAWLGGQLGDSKALEHAEKAYSLAPDSPEVMDTLGVLLAKAGQPERGAELLRKAVQTAPENNAIRLNLAKTLIQAGDKAAARKELEVLAVKGAQFAWKDEVDALLRGL